MKRYNLNSDSVFEQDTDEPCVGLSVELDPNGDGLTALDGSLTYGVYVWVESQLTSVETTTQ